MPRHLISLPAALLAALLPLTALAQSPAEPLELAAAERILLDANPAIQQARAAQAAARAGIDMAGARPNPQLTLGSTSTDPGRAGSRGFWNSWTDNTVRVDQLFERGNKRLRAELAKLAKKVGGEVYYPRTEFCTDNGAMIAYAGMQRLKNNEVSDLAVEARPRWPIDTLTAIEQ